jgi:hypothetical protein
LFDELVINTSSRVQAPMTMTINDNDKNVQGTEQPLTTTISKKDLKDKSNDETQSINATEHRKDMNISQSIMVQE